jgi:AraC-like DNA-binding protein/quercetin dioxygenase-like cupin family protein
MDGKDLIERSPYYASGHLLKLAPGQTSINDLHRHESMTELLLVTEGGGRFVIDGKEYTVIPGTLLIHQQGVWHKEYVDPTRWFKALYLGFSALQVKGLPDNYLVGLGETPVLQLGEGFTDYEQLILQIIRERQGGLPEADAIANGWLSVLIGRLVQRLHHNSYEPKKRYSSSVKSVLAVKQLIEGRYQENWTLERLAQEVFLSPFHLCRQFKRKTGWSPGQYIIHCRIEAAKHYLTSTNDTMEQIADRIGYRSETHFHHVFKNSTGITPGHYRVIKRGENVLRKH